jgi:monoamine oxidase
LKVILAFSKAFWPEGFFDVVCTDCFIPEFWVTSYASRAGSSTGVHCMTGFIAGKRAEDLSALRPSNIITNALNQLDQMFGEPHLHSTLHLSSQREVQR